MDLILENIQPNQIPVFKKMAKLLHIKTKLKNKILSEDAEELALLMAMEEGLKSSTLTDKEQTNFLNSLGK